MFQRIRKNDLINQSVNERAKDGRNLGEENVLIEMNNPDSLQQRILELNQRFSLIDFLMGESEVETAIGVITPKQSLFLECELVDTDHHAYNFQALYNAIYDANSTILPYKNKNTWQEFVMQDGNIAIQLTKFGDFYLWCPEKIDEYQLNSLKEIDEQLKSMQMNHSILVQPVFLDIHAWVGIGNGKEISIELEDASLDYLLNYYEDNKQDSYDKMVK